MSNVFIENLNVGDGQVQIVATQIAAGAANKARRMNVTFANVGGQNETLVLTLSRNGGTPRRLKRVVLELNEQLEVCGLPLNLQDVLFAQTTDAASIDYLVSIAATEAPLTMHVYDDKGGLKTAPYILEQLDAITG